MIERARPHLAVRLVWLIVAALQVSLGAAATIAEAKFLLDSDRADAKLHVEAEGPRHNPPVHPDDCAVCQYLTSRSSRTEVFQLPCLAGVIGKDDLPGTAESYHRQGGLALPLPRAPPSS